MTAFIPPHGPSAPEWMRQVAGQLNPFFLRLANLPNYTDDTTAAAGGVGIGELYRNGSVVMVRVA